MMARNPYDRRREPLRQSQMGRDSDTFSALPGPFKYPPSLTIEELEAMAFSARARGHREEMARALEREHAARRQAWDEGNATGLNDGRHAAVWDFERLHRVRLREVQSVSLSLLERLREEPRKVSRADLAGALEEAQALLTGILNSHEFGFRVFE